MSCRIVESAPTGETFIFDDEWNEADGRVRRIEYKLAPNKGVPLHFHPRTAQSFEVVSGCLHVKVNGREQVLNAGARLSTGPGDRHTQWNADNAPVHACPPSSTERQVEGIG